MLPPRCSSPPCMNIAVNSVSQVGVVGAGQPWRADLLARVGDLVRDRPRSRRGCRSSAWLSGLAERQPALLPEEVGEHVQRDQRDRDDREAQRRDVVLEREHRPGTVAGAPLSQPAAS